MNEVTSLAMGIPSLGKFAFPSSISEIAVLYVNESVLEDYKNSDWAKYFSEILPINSSKVEFIEDNTQNIETYFKVYNLNGVNDFNTTDRFQVKDLPKGLYIINGKKNSY